MGVVLDYSIEAGSGTVEELDTVARDILTYYTSFSSRLFPYCIISPLYPFLSFLSALLQRLIDSIYISSRQLKLHLETQLPHSLVSRCLD